MIVKRLTLSMALIAIMLSAIGCAWFTVIIAEGVTLYPVPGETGTVWGHRYLAHDWKFESSGVVDGTMVGWGERRGEARTFFSFDLSPLTGVEVKQAKIVFPSAKITGDPWGMIPDPRAAGKHKPRLGTLRFEQVYYGPRHLEPKDFSLPRPYASNLHIKALPAEFDVTHDLRANLIWKKPRYQVALHFDIIQPGLPQDPWPQGGHLVEFSTSLVTCSYCHSGNQGEHLVEFSTAYLIVRYAR